MRTFGLEDIDDIRNAPRALTLVEEFALAEAAWHMREKRMTTRGHQLRIYELLRKAMTAYRGHKSCPWFEITYHRRDGKIWDPTKIANRAATFEQNIRKEQEAGKNVYLVPKEAAAPKVEADPDDAAVVDPKRISPLALAAQAAASRNGFVADTPEAVELVNAQAELAALTTKNKGGRPRKVVQDATVAKAVQQAEGKRTLSTEGRARIAAAASERWAKRRAEQENTAQ